MQQYDVAIVGLGITGTALGHVLTNYTDTGRVVGIEKYGAVAQVSSSSRSNAQTLHDGAFETNFSLEKALKVQRAATLVKRYLESNPGIHSIHQKMVLGVGPAESRLLQQRFDALGEHYPGLERIGRERIAELEPNIVEGRDPVELTALYHPHAYTVDYGRLAASFLERSSVEPMFNTEVRGARWERNGYILATDKGDLHARAVAFCAGAYSLLFAKALGYGFDYMILPIKGGFYYTPKVLNGKVYTVQREGLPFAAVHGDPDLNAPDRTRFGPTALVTPFFENGGKGLPEWLRSTPFTIQSMQTLRGILGNETFRKYAIENLEYLLPGGNARFLEQVHKIVPGITLDQLSKAQHMGGIRPQLVDTKRGEIAMGEAKIDIRNGFCLITPSPGATRGFETGVERAKELVGILGGRFHHDRFEREYGR